jgi:basic membrane protein A
MALICCLLASSCRSSSPVAAAPRLRVGLVADSGTENDRGFNEYTLKGAREAALASGLDFTYLTSPSDQDYERNIESLIAQGAQLVITVGFRMGDATARAARRHPDRKFAIVDTAFSPGSGCPETAHDCYTPAGGLANVTSLMFAEDQLGYLAGVLAGCMSQTDVVASVAGLEIPPVVRFVTGFQNGAHAVRPAIKTLNTYIPDFNDPISGKVTGQGFIRQGADVIFVAAGNTGNGGLLAAHEAGIMAIGVDVDQYYTYPDVAPSLLTSASKKVDVAANEAVKDFAAGKLAPGIRLATLANGGIGLAPYHDWDARIPQACKDKVAAATAMIKASPAATGVK